MRSLPVKKIGLIIAGLLVVLMPAFLQAQPERPAQPQIGPPLVREGDLAVNLLQALGLGTTPDEIEAETRLGDAGIVPRNGWIADYPVTPDVAGELQKSVGDAADSKRLKLSKAEAVKKLNETLANLELSFIPGQAAASQVPPVYPNPDELNEYYTDEGPPVYTYYSPPPDYYYLYEFIPYPFWWYDFWFPGFFVLTDFHRHIFFHDRVVFCSNHFRDVRAHRVFRIDPTVRLKGRTFAGIGAPRTGNFMRTGVAKSDVRIFNAPAPRGTPGMIGRGRPGGTVAGPPSGGRGGMTGPAPGGGMGAPSHGGPMMGPSPSGGGAPAGGGGHPSGGGMGGGGPSGGGGFGGGSHGGGGHR
jgi:hypothetical protein